MNNEIMESFNLGYSHGIVGNDPGWKDEINDDYDKYYMEGLKAGLIAYDQISKLF